MQDNENQVSEPIHSGLNTKLSMMEFAISSGPTEGKQSPRPEKVSNNNYAQTPGSSCKEKSCFNFSMPAEKQATHERYRKKLHPILKSGK